VIADAVSHTQAYELGGTLAPFDCYLTLRGLKTLPLRMDRHERNATRIAEFLADHPATKRVIYPGLTSHPRHDAAEAVHLSSGEVVLGV